MNSDFEKCKHRVLLGTDYGVSGVITFVVLREVEEKLEEIIEDQVWDIRNILYDRYK